MPYLAIFLLLALLSLLPAEVMLRFLGRAPSVEMAGLYAAFGQQSYRLATNIDTSADWASGLFTVHTDALGLRCDRQRRHATQPGTTLDYVFLGDSQGFGNGCNFEETIAGAFAELATPRGLRTANLGVGGHTLRNQIEVLRWLTDSCRVQVRHIIVLLTPVMITSADKYTHAHVGRDGRLYGKDNHFLGRLLILVKTHSAAYAQLRNAVRHVGIGATPSTTPSFVLDLFNPQAALAERERQLAATLAQLRTTGSANAPQVTLVYVPLAAEANFAVLQSAARTQGLELDPAIPYRLCRAAAQQLGLPLLSLRALLDEQRQQAVPLQLVGDHHYSAPVARSAGRKIWQEITPPAAPATAFLPSP